MAGTGRVASAVFSRDHLWSLFPTGKATDTPHTTPFCLEEDTQNPVTPSSCQTASQSEGAVKEATRGGGQVENIYSNAEYSAEPRAQSEDLCYTTVSFSTAPPESPVASIAEFYSIIRYLPQDESLVYSNVWTSTCLLSCHCGCGCWS